MRIVAVLAALVCAAATAVAAPGGAATKPVAKPPFRLLFVGNSQTSTNDLPSFVTAIARTRGDRIYARAIAPTSVTLEDLWWTHRYVVPLFTQHWDAVVIQQGPSVVPENRQRLCLYAPIFADQARAAGGRPYLMMVWPRKGTPLAPVVDAYSAAAVVAKAGLIPSGVAWDTAMRRLDGLDLYRADGIHPNRIGSYLAAVTVYAALRRIPAIAPNAIVVDGNPFWISPESARALRDAARAALTKRYSSSTFGCA